MKIVRIEIEEFGKLADFVLEPGTGITLIEGENESGKSTLLAFLRFAFYGFPRRGGPDGEERDKRLSWRSRRAVGRLEVESAGVIYRITRRCIARGSTGRESFSEELSVIRLPEGEEVPLDGKTPGEYFLGLPAELYDGSLCLAQSGAERVSAPGMGEAVGNLLFAGESAFSAEEAENKLQQARRDLQHLKGRGGRIADLEDELAALDGALARAREDGARLADLRADARRYREGIEEKRKALSEVAAAFECADIDRTLSLFDDRARALNEEARCRTALEDLQERLVTELPDRSFTARTELALHDVRTAEATVAQLCPVVEQLEQVKYDEALLNGARALREKGGTEALMGAVSKNERKAKRRRITGMICLVLAAAAALSAVLLPTYFLYAAAGAAVMLLISLFAFLGGALCRHKIKRLIGDLGGIDMQMMRTHLEQCRREEESYLAHRERKRIATEQLEAAQQKVDRAREQMRNEFSAIGHPELADATETAERFLHTLANRKEALQAAVAESTIAYERARSATEALSRRLEGEDEQGLRARRAAVSVPNEDLEALRTKQTLLEQSVAALEQKRADTERAESALAATARDPQLLERERLAVSDALVAARRRLAAIRLALEALEKASDDLRRGITPRLREEASRIFADLTDGVHGELRLGADFSMTLEGEGVPRSISHFSAGCRDAAHLSLRLALLHTLSKERLPLFFDEAFARLDDSRTQNLLSVLQNYCRDGGQCLLFTCHTREGAFLSNDDTVKCISLA
ncbi:MAG: AAA family ATPase [Clostridia bacterium]|nr:AAA family ATPase [Clostridia bacterium]